METVIAESLLSDSSTLIVAAIVALLTILVALLLFRKSLGKTKDTVLFLGLSDAGKTLIFGKLVSDADSAVIQTYTSMKENIYDGYSVDDSKSAVSLTLVDVPGADKIRKLIADQHFSQGKVRGVMFVVDSSTFAKTSKDVAQFLYDILCEAPPNLPVLVACNKQDLSMAKSAQVVQSGLEKEFNLLNRSRAAALESTEGGGVGNRMLGRGGEFHWEDLSQKITFRECSAKDEEGLREIQDWIVSI